MATYIKPEYNQSANDESDNDDQEPVDDEDDEPEDKVASILKQLQSSGALIKAPKKEHRCETCDENFSDWPTLENHLLQHVTLPSIILEKLPSDDELDNQASEDDWSDEEEASTVPSPQKIDVSQLSKMGLQIKKPSTQNNSNSALNKLSGLGFTIKKNTTPIKQEKQDTESSGSNNDILKRLGNLGGLKLKLKSDGNVNSFKVVNGLKDFKTSDDEDGSDNEGNKDNEYQGSEPDSDEDQRPPSASISRKSSASDDSSSKTRTTTVSPTKIVPKVEPLKISTLTQNTSSTPSPPVRRGVKQTPKRGANLPLGARVTELPTQTNSNQPQPSQSKEITQSDSTPQRKSQDSVPDNVVVKQEIEEISTPEVNPTVSTSLFSGQIKEERWPSPPPPNVLQTSSDTTPLISRVKTENDPVSTTGQAIFSSQSTPQTTTTPLLPVTKTENPSVTVIEINGDSNDEDDDCCVVSATPAPDVKPVIPKTENASSYSIPPVYPTSTTSTNNTPYSSMNTYSSGLQTKNHSFNWNAPDSKPPISMLERSTDDIFESLLSSATKKESGVSDSEYISLDTLGPQHSCDICNTRFTSISLLEDHIRQTGHSKSLVTPTSSLMPYHNQTPNSILSSLLPMKQLADQVGKIQTLGGSSSSGFTHQQNVMINIQAYPGAGGMMPPQQQPYNSYPGQNQNMPPGYPAPPQSNMYGNQQTVPGQYPGQYVGQTYGQQQSYGGGAPHQQYPPMSDYQTNPLQGMQQTTYGQNGSAISSQAAPMGHMNQQMPPPQYVPASSPGGAMRPPAPPTTSGVRIQNIQTIQPGQLAGPNGQPIAPGQVVSAQSPGQVRVAGPAGPGVSRPGVRMPGSIRGARPSIRPGVQVQGQMKGMRPGGPRMNLKRPGVGPGGPQQKRRTDMLLPGKHDNEDCHVMAMQKQREGMPMIHSVQGAKDKINLGSQISITKKTVNRQASAMANVLASRGISIKQKQRSRSPSPERPLPHIPNLGAGMSIKHTSKSSNFSIPESKVGSSNTCKICRKIFSNQNSLAIHMVNAHPTHSSKINIFKCDECPASYPKSLQLQHHKRVFHNMQGGNREMGIPIVDMSQEENLKRLNNLGIFSFIPLANREQPDGTFGIPIISTHNMQNGLTSSLKSLGADGLLSLGPLKPLPN